MAKKRKKRTRPPLDSRHLLAIDMLTTVPTRNRDVIARKCGVNRRTLYRWEMREDFTKAQNKATQETIRVAMRGYSKRRQLLTSIGDIERLFNAHNLI